MSGVFTRLVDGGDGSADPVDWAREYRAHLTPLLREVGIDPDAPDLAERLNEAEEEPESRLGAVARLWAMLWKFESDQSNPVALYDIGLAAAVLAIRHLAPDVTYGQEKRAVNRERAGKAATAKAEKDAQRREAAAELVERRRSERPHDTVQDVVAWAGKAMAEAGLKPLGARILSDLVPPAKPR